VTAWTADRVAAGDYLSEQRGVGGTHYALVLTAEPRQLPASLSVVSFEELRSGDNDGTLTWLWDRVNTGAY
jgi:hypothetical protein